MYIKKMQNGVENSQFYPANFGDATFKKTTEMNRLKQDNCYNQRKDIDNGKKLKYAVTNFTDLADAQTDKNFFGIDISANKYGPSPNEIDDYSNLINGTKSGTLTNCKKRKKFTAFPLNEQYKGHAQHGDILKRDQIRNSIQIKKKSILPKSSDYYNRVFHIFDESQDIDTPDPSKSIETPSSGFILGRSGAPSRFDDKFTKDKFAPLQFGIANSSNEFKY